MSPIPTRQQVTVTKAWNDKNDQDGIRPESITVKLLADGQETKETLTLSSGNNWTGTFNGLNKYKDGKKITYTIEEVSVNGYSTLVTGDASTGFVITNSHTPETIDISGSKTWDDKENQDGKRPESITIRLYADGKELSRLEVNEEDNWKWLFEDLPKYENGREIAYTITEDAVTDYTAIINAYDVTNSYTPDLQKDPHDYHHPVQPGTPGDGQTTPKTGDTSSFAGWIGLLSLSGIGLAVTSFNIVRKKHKR